MKQISISADACWISIPSVYDVSRLEGLLCYAITTTIDFHFQVNIVLDRKQVGKRVKILRETREVLHKLSKQPISKGLSRSEQSELKRYNKWLSSACKELDKLVKMGEHLMKQIEPTTKSVKMQQSFNLQYLKIQQSMQEQNQQFTLVSNIMKVKHDTAKSAINNVR